MSTSSNEQAQLLGHPSSTQSLLTVDPKGRNRASAVVLGIALSVGTSSLLLPIQTRKAAALSSSLPAEVLESNSLVSPITTPSPIASPIPSALQLALSTAANPVAASSGYNSVVQGGEELLSLSKQSLTTPSPVAVVPTLAASPTPDLGVATLTPEATPTLNELANIDGSISGESTPASVAPNENAVATPSPALPAPVGQQAQTAEARISPIQTLSLLSPTPTTTPTVTPDIVVPQDTIKASNPNSTVESPAIADRADHAVDLSEVPVLPGVNATEVAALPTVAPGSELKTPEVAPPVDSTAKLEPVEESPIQQLEQSKITATPEKADPSVPQAVTTGEKTESSEPQTVAILAAPKTTGQPLVPTPVTPDMPGAVVGSSHRVNRGDTLIAIARRYGVSVSELISANNITNPNQILVDQDLSIPQSPSRGIGPSVAQGAPLVMPLSAPEFPNAEMTLGGASIALQPAIDSSLNTSSSTNPYLQNLKAEIEALQQKYQQQGVPQFVGRLSAGPSVASKLTPSEPVNSEFVRDRASAPRPTPSMGMGGEVQRVAVRPALETPAASYPATTYNVAVAPLTPSSYVPTLEPSSGGSAAELPRLAAANTYLPNEVGEFKGYIWPTKGVLTSGYGWRWGRMHRGIDVAGPTGTPIVAAATGVIEYAQWNSGGYGYLVDIRHPDGSLTRYAHNSRIVVREGQRVQQGQLIAEMGSTGFSTGPHLHFEIHSAGQGAVNPMALMPSNAPS
jgi:murein DD-endopeptidase MepM/ murein hydrolase activator NlpD